jgi:formylglycine-generating enzyme required for sulfatase activity
MFERVLRAFEIGDLAFSDLQSSLTRLLKDGAPAEELLRVLRRRESIEPLPEDARDRIIAALHEGRIAGAVENGSVAAHPPQAAAKSPDVTEPLPADEEPDSSAMSRLIKEFAAAWDMEPKARPASPAATTPPESNGQNVDYKAMCLVLGKREDDLAALQAEHSRVLGLLEARARNAAQLQEELRELSGQLEASRGALQLQESKTREIEEVLAERIAAEEAARMRSEQARGEEAARHAGVHHTELSVLRESLAARDAQIGVLQGENERLARSVDSGAQLAAKLQADLAATQAIVASHETQSASHKTQIAAARLAIDSERSRAATAERAAEVARDAWADKVLALQRRLDQRDIAIEALTSELHSRDRAVAAAREQHVKPAQQADPEQQANLEQQADFEPSADLEQARDLEQVGDLKQAPKFEQESELEHTLPLQTALQTPPRLGMRRDFAIGEFTPGPPAPRVSTRKRNALVWIVGSCAAIAVLAVVGWLALRHMPAAAKVPELAAAPLPTPGTVIRDCPTCPSVTVLPTGRFKQGSADANASSAVRPVHWVAIDHPFAMSTSAVTVAEFGAFATATGRDMQGCDTYDGRWKHQARSSWQNPGFEQGGTHPVTCASWSDATAYAQWLSAQTGHHYRLPSASEWEYAARAGSDAPQPWLANGSDACANANVADLSAVRRFPGWVGFACNDGYVFTAPVGSFKANAFGLNDMLGNVFQWTQDCWNANYKDASIDGSARTDGNCSEHELRGGSWFSSPGYVRADYRNHFAANYRASSAGIRLVRDMTP